MFWLKIVNHSVLSAVESDIAQFLDIARLHN